MRRANGPIWPFEKMWDKPHYNEATEVSDAPGTPDVEGLGSPDSKKRITPIHDPWCGYWYTGTKIGVGAVWPFEPMWRKPHYNEGTYISNAPGVTDAPGHFDQDPPISNGSNGPIWAFEAMWNKPHYNEGDIISNAPGEPDAVGHDEQQDIHQPWCGYWYKK